MKSYKNIFYTSVQKIYHLTCSEYVCITNCNNQYLARMDTQFKDENLSKFDIHLNLNTSYVKPKFVFHTTKRRKARH